LIDPLCAAEMRGYLMHCFRLAGVDFEHIFEPGSSALVHELSGGIPRMANNIVEGVLGAAATGSLEKIPSSFVAEIAEKEFGLVATDFVAPTTATAPQPAPEQVSEPVEVPEPEAVTEPAPEPTPEEEAEPVAEATQEPDPVIVFSDETDGPEAPVDENDIPELIQDTLPDLEILAPEVVAAEPAPEDQIPELTPEPVADIEPAPQPVFEDAPTPEPEPEPVVTTDSPTKDVPEWERDPTLAQLKPDLDALEKAMAIAQGDSDDEPEFEPIGLADTPEPVAEPEPEEIPEITLDNAIQSRIEDSLIDEPGQISPNAPETPTASDGGGDMPEVKIAPRKSKKADAEIEKIAAELAKAKTIEDVDDKLAETLFGEELNFIASQVVANAPSAESANDGESTLFDTNTAQIAQASGSATPEAAVVARSGVEVSLKTPEHSSDGGMDLTASQRLKTVRALNADASPPRQENAAVPPPEPVSEPPPPVATPEPIEDQINTSMTQTLKALNVRPPISDNEPASNAKIDDDDDEEEEKSGFFSRFRRS
jgi:hypothetical protein